MEQEHSGTPLDVFNISHKNKDLIAHIVFILGGHLTVWYEAFVILPTYHRTTTPIVWFHYIFTAVVYINCFSNLYLMKTTKTTGDPKVLQAKKRGYWKYCEKCTSYQPPRSHHCKVCDVCVIKRDHHCWFAACCVGYNNHRYYLVCIFWVWLAAVYCNLYNLQFVGDVMGGHTLGTWLCITTPHVAAVLGQFTLYQFFVAAMTFTGSFFLIMVTILIYEQTMQIRNGQTKFERKLKFRGYNQSWRENITEVLGDQWFLIWIIPGFYSRLPGDGICYSKDDKNETNMKEAKDK